MHDWCDACAAHGGKRPFFVGLLMLGVAAAVAAQTPPLETSLETSLEASSEALLESLQPPALRTLADESLERNPEIARARRHAAAAATRAPQVRALPDPTATLNLFLLPPETRVGAQRLTVAAMQRFPWMGKLKLREQAAVYAASAALAHVEEKRLDVLLEARKRFYELAFLAEREAILLSERETLERFEEAARARYSTGAGKQQESLRIQAQITRVDTRLLEVEERRVHLLAALNALRDRPASTAINAASTDLAAPAFVDRLLLEAAQSARPEIAAVDARIARRGVLVELAEKNSRPDLTAGFSYTLVERRDDRAGRLNPPEDDGEDVFALSGSINLPIRREKLAAEIEEAHALRRAVEEEKRALLRAIESRIGDLDARLPMLWEHAHLLENVLSIQAHEALNSAEAAYTAGKSDALDLLDAEVVLFEVRTAAARTRFDYAVAWAELERAVGRPLAAFADSGEHHE